MEQKQKAWFQECSRSVNKLSMAMMDSIPLRQDCACNTVSVSHAWMLQHRLCMHSVTTCNVVFGSRARQEDVKCPRLCRLPL